MGRVQGQASQASISVSLGLELCVRSLFGNKGLRLGRVSVSAFDVRCCFCRDCVGNVEGRSRNEAESQIKLLAPALRSCCSVQRLSSHVFSFASIFSKRS